MKALYHATYASLLNSILKDGLKLPEGYSNWDMYAGEYIYLADDPYVAESYAECADHVPEDVFKCEIVILEVQVEEKDLAHDPNIRCAEEYENSFVVSKPIPASNIKIWREGQ